MNPVNSGTVFCFACGLGVACYAIKRNVDNFDYRNVFGSCGCSHVGQFGPSPKDGVGKKHENNYSPLENAANKEAS